MAITRSPARGDGCRIPTWLASSLTYRTPRLLNPQQNCDAPRYVAVSPTISMRARPHDYLSNPAARNLCRKSLTARLTAFTLARRNTRIPAVQVLRKLGIIVSVALLVLVVFIGWQVGVCEL